MAAVTKRAIHCQFAGLGRERFQNLRDHDGPMRACWRFAGREDFRDGVGVTLRIALLVFLLEPARILAGVTRASAMRPWRAFRRRDRCGIVGHSSLQALVSDIAKTRCTNARPDASKGSEYPTRCLILEQASGSADIPVGNWKRGCQADRNVGAPGDSIGRAAINRQASLGMDGRAPSP